MKYVNTPFIALVLFSLGSGCATVVQNLSLKNMEDGSWKGSGILLGARFSGSREGLNLGQCRIELREETSGQFFEAHFEPDARTVLIEARSGRYFGKEIQCARYRSWDISSLFPGGISVASGKISYGGDILFQFSDDAKSLSLVPSPRKETLEFLATAYHKLHPSRRAQLVSGYTGRGIRSSMLAAGSSGELQIKVTKFQGQENVEMTALTQALADCGNDSAFTQDRVRAGHLHLDASYAAESGKVEVVEDLKNSALAESYESCLVQALETFKPGVKLGVSVSY